MVFIVEEENVSEGGFRRDRSSFIRFGVMGLFGIFRLGFLFFVLLIFGIGLFFVVRLFCVL